MKAGYSTALQLQAGSHHLEDVSKLSMQKTIGAAQGCGQQPCQQASEQTPAHSFSASAQGIVQQDCHLSAPLRPITPQTQHQGSLLQMPQHQGSGLQLRQHQGGFLQVPQLQASLLQQPCAGQSSTAGSSDVAQHSALMLSHAQQQLPEEEVCCAQPVAPMVQSQPVQQVRHKEYSQMQAQAGVKGQAADRASSSGPVGTKGEGSKDTGLDKAASHTESGNRANSLPPSKGHGPLSRVNVETSALDKENAPAGMNRLCSYTMNMM